MNTVRKILAGLYCKVFEFLVWIMESARKNEVFFWVASVVSALGFLLSAHFALKYYQIIK